MFQGTASSVGKSLLVSALCRILHQDGYRAMPFKAQNMALNSYATKEGLEMGRAQVTQAQAACVEPSVRMNPVLLKPTSDHASQVIVNGRPIGVMNAREYQAYKPKLRPVVAEAYRALAETCDFVVLEGAGSPAEINLREGDIVNMGMAEIADAPVLLVGDINLGGVFASLLGTVMLLSDEERARVKGVVINKFRGDVRLLEPGLRMLEERIHIPVLGVIPWMEVDLEDEDSANDRFIGNVKQNDVDVAIVRLRHISNFTDFQHLDKLPGVSVHYVTEPEQLKGADIVILPGSKSTVADLEALRAEGMDAALLRHAGDGGLLIGICGGYQMLAKRLLDPERVESGAERTEGLGLLDMEVRFGREKVTVQAEGRVCAEEGWLGGCAGIRTTGYEIHMGENAYGEGCLPWLQLTRLDGAGQPRTDGRMNREGNVLGTYLHGLFDEGELWQEIVNHVRRRKELPPLTGAMASADALREQSFDRLAKVVRESLDMEAVYRILRGEA